MLWTFRIVAIGILTILLTANGVHRRVNRFALSPRIRNVPELNNDFTVSVSYGWPLPAVTTYGDLEVITISRPGSLLDGSLICLALCACLISLLLTRLSALVRPGPRGTSHEGDTGEAGGTAGR